MKITHDENNIYLLQTISKAELKDVLRSIILPDVPTEPEPPIEPEPPVTEPINPFNVLLNVDFSNHKTGPYELAQWRKDWNNTGSPWSGLGRNSIVSFNGEKWMREEYPAGQFGSRGTGSNFEGIIPNGDDLKEMYLSYNIYYPSNWDFVLGQKLPGIRTMPKAIAGGIDYAYPNDAGITARLMTNKDALLTFYFYHHGMPVTVGSINYAHNLGQGRWSEVEKGQILQIVNRYVMNDIGKANGITQTWVNGVLAASATNVEYRTNASPQGFNRVMYCTFMGGNSLQWSPSKNQYTLMNGLKVWNYSKEYLEANPSVPRGLKLWTANQEFKKP